MRIKTWTDLYIKAEALTIFDRAERSQRYLDALLIVPADVGIHFGDELFDRDGLPVSWIEKFGFQSAEEPFARGVVLRASLSGHRANRFASRASDDGLPDQNG